MTSDDELLKRLEKLVILDEVGSDNPLGRQASARIRELEAERNRWEALCEKAWKDLDKMGFQGLYEAFGNGPTHVIVPVEPTPEMKEAGWDNQLCGGDETTIYQAMIRAAQPDAKRQQGE